MSQSTTTLSSLEDEDDGNARRLTSLRLRISLAVPAVVFVVVLAFEALQLGSLGSALGAALGLLAGCISAVGYSLACPEASPAFVALWYSTGLLLTTVLGALLGPRWLKW